MNATVSTNRIFTASQRKVTFAQRVRHFIQKHSTLILSEVMASNPNGASHYCRHMMETASAEKQF